MFSTYGNHATLVGIGDDAAVLRRPRDRVVWTVDSSVQDVHFRRGWLSEQDIGWRSFQAAASDLAAMGATPVGALSALELPTEFDDRALQGLLTGQQAAAAELRCPIVGGNLARSSVLAITTTVLGTTRRPILRGGARVGDEVWLVGEVGLAAAGLAILASEQPRRRGPASERCVAAWRRPAALIQRGRALNGRATSAIDVSDGLVGDAQHLADSSRVGIEFDMDRLVESGAEDLHRVAEALSRSVLEFILFGGEDYALLASGPANRRPRWARPVGRVSLGKGVWGRSSAGGKRRLRNGFDHFLTR